MGGAGGGAVLVQVAGLRHGGMGMGWLGWLAGSAGRTRSSPRGWGVGKGAGARTVRRLSQRPPPPTRTPYPALAAPHRCSWAS